MKHLFNVLILSMSLYFFNACSDDGNDFPKVVPYPVEEPQPEPEKPAEMEQYTVFNSGDDNVNSYRIPSICTTKNGTLLAFGEARRDTWQDRSYTNIVVKRSTDNGKTWSKMQYVTSVSIEEGGSPGAFINPCPVVDMETGKIFLFTVYWKTQSDALGYGTKAYLVTSVDDGQNWSEPKNVSAEILTTSRHKKTPYSDYAYQYICGFGPGAGCQMQGEQFKGRLIVPSLQSFITNFGNPNKAENAKKSVVTVYSDDHGETWHAGNVAQYGGEYQITESPYNTLIYNLRGNAKGRGYATSTDGGIEWSDWSPNIQYYPTSVIPSISCQGSVLGIGNMLYYSGPAGGTATTDYDDRCKLMLYTSSNSGTTWDAGQLLYEKAAGYSCLTKLKDGRIAVLFEAGSKAGFEKLANRPAGWMRLDLIILPNK